jgi:adenylosuccinate synthase
MRAIIVCDLGYGDAGKGSIVDFLAATEDVGLVVKYTGGPQAAHNVVMDGKQHTFSQFGSATLRGIPTWIGEDVLIDPLALATEAAHLVELGVQRPFDLLTIHEDARIITPWHKWVGRCREQSRGPNRHGSTGQGVGELMFDVENGVPPVRAADVRRTMRALSGLLHDVQALQFEKVGEPLITVEPDASTHPTVLAETYMEILGQIRIAGGEELARDLAASATCVLEGSQGVLLDQDAGFHPHTTWADTSPRNAVRLIWDHCYVGYHLEVLGVIRSYMVRHGDGPFPTETDAALTMPGVRDEHNQEGRWQGPMRYGFFDQTALRYAIRVCADRLCAPTALAVTHMDQYVPDIMGTYFNPKVPATLREATENTAMIEQTTPTYKPFPGFQDALGIPMHIASYGPTAEDKLVADYSTT